VKPGSNAKKLRSSLPPLPLKTRMWAAPPGPVPVTMSARPSPSKSGPCSLSVKSQFRISDRSTGLRSATIASTPMTVSVKTAAASSAASFVLWIWLTNIRDRARPGGTVTANVEATPSVPLQVNVNVELGSGVTRGLRGPTLGPKTTNVFTTSTGVTGSSLITTQESRLVNVLLPLDV
jgi:hypothetical protein